MQLFAKKNHLQSQGYLKGDTETEIITTQGHALQTKYHATKILKTETQTNI